MYRNRFSIKNKNMKNKHFTLLAILLVFGITNAFAQCVIQISDGQPYTENFDSGTMECWTVEATGAGTWAVMTGAATNVAAFQNATTGDEARLISPTFDLSGVSGATFSFSYAMMALYNNDVLTVSYRCSETDPWHELDHYSLNDWSNTYEATFDLPDISSTYQISFLAQSNGGYYIFIDNVEIVGAGGCARPVNLEAIDVTAYTALLGWSTTGNEESWVLEMNGNQKNVDTQPFLMEGLEEQTEYTFRVKANCGGGMESEWSYPSTFKTLCDVIVVTDDEPYFDDFEGSDDFICWQNEIFSGDYGWAIDPGYLILNNTAYFFWLGGEGILYSAPLDITAVSNPTLEFKHKQPLAESWDRLYVGYRTSPTDTWHVIGSYEEPATDWVTEVLPLPEISAELQICFDAFTDNGDGNGVYVDDVRVGNNGTVGVTSQNDILITNGDAIVYDLFGRRVATTKYHNGRLDLDMNGLARGVYVAHIKGTQGSTTIKLVKE